MRRKKERSKQGQTVHVQYIEVNYIYMYMYMYCSLCVYTCIPCLLEFTDKINRYLDCKVVTDTCYPQGSSVPSGVDVSVHVHIA